ncbi:MAG: MBL fold metallo-hydrolase [Gammaproteobacteria bacterium]|nr:MBL fold metallo-hydrolase [Gammaproteobacteria bacterium]MDH5171817.1 MBL fold metallo-hydrolase [Gammaproteobacteria bacterium]
MKKSLIIIVVIAAIGLLAWSQRVTILTRVMEKGLEARMGADIVDSFEDGLHLALCGAGGPMPAPNASGPCVVVVAGKQMFVVDAGTDGLRNIARMGYQPAQIQGVFLTHFHSDHIDGLGEMATIRWVNGANTTTLPVYGPEGVQRVVDGFNESYSLDAGYRHAHHGDTVAPLSGAGMVARPFTTPEPGELVTVVSNAELKVEALRVDHSPIDPAVGYRFTYKERSLLITGDTVKLANIEKFAQGVDLLVHEALAPNLVGMMHDTAAKSGDRIMTKITDDILNYHTSPVEAAQTARDAGVGHLLYYHIVPPLVFPGQDILFLNGAQDIFPDYTIGQDGVSFSLPAGSKEIIVTSKGL